MLISKNFLSQTPESTAMTLGSASKGFRGIITAVDASACAKTGMSAPEIERRLMEMGFIEGSIVEIKHEGFWGGDPIAVKVDNATIALRRCIANAIHISPLQQNKPSGAKNDE